MKRVPLYYKGELYAEAIVDDDDFEWISKYRWHTHRVSRIDPEPGYAYTSFGGKAYAMHRAVMGLEPGEGKVVHHVNEDRLDNRRSNLVVCEDLYEHGQQEHPKKEARVRARMRELVAANPGWPFHDYGGKRPVR